MVKKHSVGDAFARVSASMTALVKSETPSLFQIPVYQATWEWGKRKTTEGRCDDKKWCKAIGTFPDINKTEWFDTNWGSRIYSNPTNMGRIYFAESGQ